MKLLKKRNAIITSMISASLLLQSVAYAEENTVQDNFLEDPSNVATVTDENLPVDSEIQTDIIFDESIINNNMSVASNNKVISLGVVDPSNSFTLQAIPTGGYTGVPKPRPGFVYNGSRTIYKSIKNQNRDASIRSIGLGILSLGSGLGGATTAATVFGVLGIGDGILGFVSGGAQYPIKIQIHYYPIIKPNPTYPGYMIYTVYNANNGKKLTSKEVRLHY